MSPSPRIRREGFPGQHLLVVPLPVQREAAAHPLLRGLMVTDAGYYPRATGHRVERPQGAATDLLILCLKGSGWAESRGHSASVGPGDAIWLPADAPHRYGASVADPWRILWAHFRGTEVAAWRRQMGWPEKAPIGKHHFRMEPVTGMGMERVFAALEAGYSLPNLLSAACALRGAFCGMIERARHSGTTRTASERIAAVEKEILLNPGHAHSLDALAASAGLSIPHFSKLFRRQTGYAPIDFVIRRRIRLACHLLASTADSVGAVGSASGFSDPYYFSRCFRRVMGLSPRAYRSGQPSGTRPT